MCRKLVEPFIAAVRSAPREPLERWRTHFSAGTDAVDLRRVIEFRHRPRHCGNNPPVPSSRQFPVPFGDTPLQFLRPGRLASAPHSKTHTALLPSAELTPPSQAPSPGQSSATTGPPRLGRTHVRPVPTTRTGKSQPPDLCVEPQLPCAHRVRPPTPGLPSRPSVLPRSQYHNPRPARTSTVDSIRGQRQPAHAGRSDALGRIVRRPRQMILLVCDQHVAPEHCAKPVTYTGEAP